MHRTVVICTFLVALAVPATGLAVHLASGDGTLVVYTKPTELDAVRKALVEHRYSPERAELSYEPATTIVVTDETTARKLMKLIDALEELDDVTSTYANFDISQELMEQIA